MVCTQSRSGKCQPGSRDNGEWHFSFVEQTTVVRSLTESICPSRSRKQKLETPAGLGMAMLQNRKRLGSF